MVSLSYKTKGQGSYTQKAALVQDQGSPAQQAM